MSHGFCPNQRIQVAGIPGVHLWSSEQIDTTTITLGERHGSKYAGESVTVESHRVRPLPHVFTERPDGAA